MVKRIGFIGRKSSRDKRIETLGAAIKALGKNRVLAGNAQFAIRLALHKEIYWKMIVIKQ